MSDDALPLFSVNQYTTFHLTFEQDVELYTKLGVYGLEFCEEKVSTDPGHAAEQMAMVRDSGLKVTSVQPKVLGPFGHPLSPPTEPTDPAARMARYRQTIDMIASGLPGEPIPLVVGCGAAPDGDYRLAHRVAREQFPPLADYAADRGLRLMFEPLSPILMNMFTFVPTLDEAMALINDVDRPNFGLCLDVWHLWREHRIAERIAELHGRIFSVHICDWPKAEPRSGLDRVLPGDGAIDLPALLGAIEHTGYDDAYCLEIYSEDKLDDSLWRADPADVIERGRDGFYRAWRSRRRDFG